MDIFIPPEITESSYLHIREKESCYLPESENWAIHHHNIDMKLRISLVNWIYQLVLDYKLPYYIFQPCINLIDRYMLLTNEKINKNKLKLIGFVSLIISTKYHDDCNYIVESDFKSLFDCQNNLNELRKIEFDILSTLDFKLKYFDVNYHVYWLTPIYDFDCNIYDMSMYFSMLVYLSNISMIFYPSKIACACTYLAIDILNHSGLTKLNLREVEKNIMEITKVANLRSYCFSDYKDIIKLLITLVENESPSFAKKISYKNCLFGKLLIYINIHILSVKKDFMMKVQYF